MKKIIFSLMLGISLNISAQSGQLKRADNYYDKVAYAVAAKKYEALIGSEVDSPKLKSKLATCYYKTNDYNNAIKYYSQVVNTSDATSEDVYNYAQSLKMAGSYSESDQWMKKFSSMKQSDSRVSQFLSTPDYREKINNKPAYFEVKTLNINTEFADFGGYARDSVTVYFVSARRENASVRKSYTWNSRNFLDIFKAQKTADNELVKPKLISKKTNTKFHEGPLCFSPDLKRVYFTRNNIDKGSRRKDNNGIQNLKLFYADVNAKGKWVNEKEVTFNSKDYSVGHPSISPDGKWLYFASNMPGGFGDADIYVAEVLNDGNLANPKNLGKSVNTEGKEMFPWMNGDGSLFFASNGHIGLGGLDNFVALPDKKTGEFKKIINCGKEINTPQDDFALIFNADQKTGFVSSNRIDGKGDDDIYAVKLIRPFENVLLVKGTITDFASKEILPNAAIKLVNKKTGEVINSALADEKGNYEFEIEPDQSYDVLVTRDKYFDNEGTFSTINLPADVEILEKDLALEKDPGLGLYVLVTDKKTKQPLEGVKLRVQDNFTNAAFISSTTSSTGDVKKGIADKKISDRLSYNIILEKEGYMTKTVTFNYKITQPGIINVHEALDLTMEKIEVGMDLAKLIDIKPIFFDLSKFNIRKDAATELDKIVKIMNEYPTMEIELGSHTDCRSSYKFNMDLSNKRALASAEYVKKRITNPERIFGKGYGESKLVNGCECEGTVKSTCSEEEHQANRRTEFLIIKM